MGCSGSKSQVHDATKVRQEQLPASVKARPRGLFQSALPPADEGRRDFARIFFANERKIFLHAEGMPGMRPLQPTAGPSAAHIGDLSEHVVERAASLFGEAVTSQLSLVSGTAPDPSIVETLCKRAMPAMTVNVGMDFALHLQLLPTFLQPFFLVIALGAPMQVRVATYGFVAEKPQQVKGDRPDTKRTPFCVRLLSPNLMSDEEADAANWQVSYSVREVQSATILQAVEAEAPMVREAISRGEWLPLTAPSGLG